MTMAGNFAKTLFLLGGLIVWLAHFLVLYGFTGLICARQLAGTTMHGIGVVMWVVLAATVVAVALNSVLLAMALAGRGPGVSREPDPELRRFWRTVSGLTAALSIVAIVWQAAPAAIVPACA